MRVLVGMVIDLGRSLSILQSMKSDQRRFFVNVFVCVQCFVCLKSDEINAAKCRIPQLSALKDMTGWPTKHEQIDLVCDKKK